MRHVLNFLGYKVKLTNGEKSVKLENFKGNNDFYNSTMVKGEIKVVPEMEKDKVKYLFLYSNFVFVYGSFSEIISNKTRNLFANKHVSQFTLVTSENSGTVKN